jgi:VWFA-related protein
VYGREGRPLAGLRPEDFEVLEDGVVQKVAFAGSEELPFNLVLLLDLSTTTLGDRAALKAAARGFIEIARPQDRVAVYALAEGYFQVISPLTADRGRLVDVIEAMPPSGGTTPLYDAMVMACAQEGLAERQERSALVIISDGIDNALHKSASGSMVPFDELLRAATGMPVLMYPILLPPPSRATSRSAAAAAPIARHRMQQLADASGGRLFPADSIQDLAPVYEQVAQELRSVYTISYYPHNQNFDGKWRRLQVHAKHLGATLRTRDGYYAR